MKGTRFLFLALCIVLVILTLLSSCTTKQHPSDALTGLSEYGTTTAPPPSLTDGLTKPPLDTENEITAMYLPETRPDPVLVLERQNKVLSRLDNKTPYEELITKTMDINAFFDKCYDILTVGGVTHGSHPLSEIDEAFGIECLRRNRARNYYSVHKLKQGGLLYIFYRLNTYQKNGFYDVFGWFVTQERLSYKDFSSVEQGSPYEDVEAVDPAADIYEQRLLSYLEKTSEQSALFFVTQHYLTDGILRIQYEFVDGKYVVQSMKYHSDFQVDLLRASSYPRYNGKILKIDAIQ